MSGGEEWKEIVSRLANVVESSFLLLCAAPAVHRTRSPSGIGASRRVWIAVGRTRKRGDYTVFVIARSRFRCLQRFREFVYCVLPVVSNINIEVGDKSCAFSWNHHYRFTQDVSASSAFLDAEQQTEPSGGDFLIDDIDDECGLLVLLKAVYSEACQAGKTFYEEQRSTHKELWTHYRSAIPMDLARLTRSAHNARTRGHASTPRDTVVERRTKSASSMSCYKGSETLKLVCLTWNVGATEPNPQDSLAPVLASQPDADLVCLGLQEVCALNARRVMQDGGEWLSWKAWAEDGVQHAYGGDLVLLDDAHLVGLLMVIFVRRELRDQVTSVHSCNVATGVASVCGNKGAVSLRFEIGPVSLAFVNAHLAAGQEHYIERCQHYRTIVDKIHFAIGEPENTRSSRRRATAHHAVPKQGEHDASVVDGPSVGGPSDGQHPLLSRPGNSPPSGPARPRHDTACSVANSASSLMDHDHIFWLGDTNSRLHWPGKLGGMPIREAAQKLQDRCLGQLLALDQLNMMRREGMAFDGFIEQPIFFLPSYKWTPNGDMLDMRTQKHIPAWTDRILHRSMARPAVQARHYDMYSDLKQSDHRLVFAHYLVPIGVARSWRQATQDQTFVEVRGLC
eukprot:TRINITY_DN21374_c0_g1_i1.p1 TRINITY_DN21374_c0_g1~~TRINITY_DN21374_c0_g1_i1.p1  ORF type:complete len:622 (-),score=92.54 TRINITY_DN21374_c0_g1_i1:193-2058(-)